MKEIIIFEKQTWREIPKENNPAFDFISDRSGEYKRSKAYILICKVQTWIKVVSKKGLIVIEIPLEGDVIRRGLFWNLKNAKLFAETLTGEKLGMYGEMPIVKIGKFIITPMTDKKDEKDIWIQNEEGEGFQINGENKNVQKDLQIFFDKYFFK